LDQAREQEGKNRVLRGTTSWEIGASSEHIQFPQHNPPLNFGKPTIE
jgi:hypothetical protein